MINKTGIDQQLAATAKKQKLQYFGHMIRAQNLCTYISEGRLDGARGRGKSRRRHKRLDWKTLAESTTTARDRKS